jgi:hypothetical protein
MYAVELGGCFKRLFGIFVHSARDALVVLNDHMDILNVLVSVIDLLSFFLILGLGMH